MLPAPRGTASELLFVVWTAALALLPCRRPWSGRSGRNDAGYCGVLHAGLQAKQVRRNRGRCKAVHRPPRRRNERHTAEERRSRAHPVGGGARGGLRRGLRSFDDLYRGFGEHEGWVHG